MSKPTLKDFAGRLDPDGKVAVVVEMMTEMNEILKDMVWKEANNMTGHVTTVRTGLPEPTWRMLNYGVQPGKSTTTKVTDVCGMLEAYAEVDKELADLNGNTAEFRLSEDMAHIEGMNQALATQLIYGSVDIDPEKITGFAARYSAQSTDKTKSGYNVIDGEGSGADNTSIYLVGWGENTCHGIFPKGSKAGMTVEDKGQETLTDAAGGRYEGYRTHYQQKAGLCLRDWRSVCRIANIDVSDLAGATPADLITLMILAIHRVKRCPYPKNLVFYANSTILQWLDVQAQSKTNVWLGMKEFAGEEVLTFRGIPVRLVDAILDNESVVS